MVDATEVPQRPPALFGCSIYNQTMPEREITHLVPPRDMADGEPPRVRLRVGDTVRRTSYAWSPAVVFAVMSRFVRPLVVLNATGA